MSDPKVITGPSVEPVTLAEARLHLRRDSTDEDASITAWIIAAREAAEHITGRAFITRTLELAFDEFPSAAIKLCGGKLLSVVSVKYTDTAGVEQTVNSANYTLDDYSEPGYVIPAYGYAWPSTLDSANAVRVRFTAGYGATAASVPEGIKAWVKTRLTSIDENRSELADGRLVVPDFVQHLLDPYKVYG